MPFCTAFHNGITRETMRMIYLGGADYQIVKISVISVLPMELDTIMAFKDLAHS